MNKLVLLLMFLLLPFALLAQTNQDPFEEALFEKLQMSKNQQASYELSGQDQMQMHQIDRSLITKLRNQNGGNTATVIQTGNDNEAKLLQKGKNLDAVIRQENHNNSVDHEMEGNDMSYSLHQDGNSNKVKTHMRGKQLLGAVTQLGEGNVLSSQLRGNGLKHEIHQQGKANTLVQTGFQSVPLIIRQRGVGMQVRINGR